MRYLLAFLLGFSFFQAHSHVGKPLSEGLKASVISDGIILMNTTGHTIKLRSISCNSKPVSIKRIRKLGGKKIQQPASLIAIPHNRKIRVAPPSYSLESLKSCTKIKLNFGSQGNFSVR